MEKNLYYQCNTDAVKAHAAATSTTNFSAEDYKEFKFLSTPTESKKRSNTVKALAFGTVFISALVITIMLLTNKSAVGTSSVVPMEVPILKTFTMKRASSSGSNLRSSLHPTAVDGNHGVKGDTEGHKSHKVINSPHDNKGEGTQEELSSDEEIIEDCDDRSPNDPCHLYMPKSKKSSHKQSTTLSHHDKKKAVKTHGSADDSGSSENGDSQSSESHEVHKSHHQTTGHHDKKKAVKKHDGSAEDSGSSEDGNSQSSESLEVPKSHHSTTGHHDKKKTATKHNVYDAQEEDEAVHVVHKSSHSH